MLINCIRYLAEAEGIRVTEQEESYTSTADFLSGDKIPVYSKDTPVTASFSGKRISRGLYMSGTGLCINADLNGSANILRKAYPDAFITGGTPDFSEALIIKHPDHEKAVHLHKRQLASFTDISHSKMKRDRRKSAA